MQDTKVVGSGFGEGYGVMVRDAGSDHIKLRFFSDYGDYKEDPPGQLFMTKNAVLELIVALEELIDDSEGT